MSRASDLIERMERETGERVDSNNFDNNAVAGLLGALARMMRQIPPSYTEKDDVAAGILIKHQMSPRGKAEKQTKEMFAELILNGMSLDDAKSLLE